MTRQPWPFNAWVQPLPTSPYPHTTATLPPNITSVARQMASTSEWRQPYRLSNLLFVTESLTLIAGNNSSPRSCILYSRITPVVVSSVTPLIRAAICDHFCGSVFNDRCSRPRTMANSGFDADVGSGTSPDFSNSTPLCRSRVASPPSSRIMFGPEASPLTPSGHDIICSVHHQYSSSVSPFQANTGIPFGSSIVPSGPTATAAAAWSCVEKMLQLAQRTSAPSSTSVSINTAVWMVMCNEPLMRAPANGLDGPNSLRKARNPGISCSARWISLRPNGASERSATR